ncbi:MAG: PhzF family phenazine biosynthesis protein [Gammaproteobacteria bacterium]
MDIKRIAAFTYNGAGGNPAGVVLLENEPDAENMQRVAREVGYAETAFLVRSQKGWNIRYFAPAKEIPFCGHATIGSGAVLGKELGAGVYPLVLKNAQEITVEAIDLGAGKWGAALQSPPTWSREEADPTYVEDVYDAFGIDPEDLDPRLPTRLIHAGANHVVVGLKSRKRLAHLGYSFETGRELQERRDLATFSFIFSESHSVFHARNPFAIGGLYEDPATGAGAAALAGYLRDIGWPNDGRIEVFQGEDIGRKSHLIVEFSATPGEGIRVSGETAVID